MKEKEKYMKKNIFMSNYMNFNYNLFRFLLQFLSKNYLKSMENSFKKEKKVIHKFER